MTPEFEFINLIIIVILLYTNVIQSNHEPIMPVKDIIPSPFTGVIWSFHMKCPLSTIFKWLIPQKQIHLSIPNWMSHKL